MERNYFFTLRFLRPVVVMNTSERMVLAVVAMEEWGCLRGCRYLLHDRDAKFCQSFRELIKTGGVNPLRLPARSPNLNSYAERWVRSVKEE
jgi:hypothetical protein